jgi:uncharacterized membrane protein
METYEEIVKRLLKEGEKALGETEKHILLHLAENTPISRDTQQDISEKLTFGQRVADKVASFGGSWPFIGIFALFLLVWIGGNVALLIIFKKKPLDPFPYILLNLFLSMLAAIQAPVIMMSQNRQAAHDRIVAQHDYEVNLKAELEIMALHQKMDELREQQWAGLIELQTQQIELLKNITSHLSDSAAQEK